MRRREKIQTGGAAAEAGGLGNSQGARWDCRGVGRKFTVALGGRNELSPRWAGQGMRGRIAGIGARGGGCVPCVRRHGLAVLTVLTGTRADASRVAAGL
jgi:hypothetical protein